jgi:hypothetical protein
MLVMFAALCPFDIKASAAVNDALFFHILVTSYNVILQP